NIYYDDPALWLAKKGSPIPPAGACPGSRTYTVNNQFVANTSVTFCFNHGGHFHVNIATPTARAIPVRVAPPAGSVFALLDLFRQVISGLDAVHQFADVAKPVGGVNMAPGQV